MDRKQQKASRFEDEELVLRFFAFYDEYVVSETLHHQAILQEDLGCDHAWNNLERVLIQKIIGKVAAVAKTGNSPKSVNY